MRFRPPSVLALLLLVWTWGCAPEGEDAVASAAFPSTAFHIHIPAPTIEEMAELGMETPVKGRVYVVIDRVGDVAEEEGDDPRRRVGVTGVPFWGKDVRDAGAGSDLRLEPGAEGVRGYLLLDLSTLPDGGYRVQALLSAWTTYHRADGHALELHRETGEGQNPWISPGNAHSEVITVRLGPEGPGDVRLSEFWGRDTCLGANVLLPRGYDENPDVRYPVLFHLGHFPGDRVPLGFEPGEPGSGRTAGFADYWMSDRAPGLIVVTIRDANPYYDTSYSVNSPNVGPYGDAIKRELIPHLEREFRMVGAPWARVLAGGSTGGWEALALQIFHPRLFGGTWAWCPDSVDFHGYPRPIWDHETGVIDRETAEYWRENFDLHHHLRARWSEIGPDLRGKIHIATGDMDSYYLELVVYRLEEFLESAADPPAEALVEYGRRRPHCWLGESPERPGEEINYRELVDEMGAYLARRAPPGAPMGWLPRWPDRDGPGVRVPAEAVGGAARRTPVRSGRAALSGIRAGCDPGSPGGDCGPGWWRR